MESLVEDTLKCSKDYIIKLIEAHEQLAVFFQGNEEGKGLETFKLYVEGIDWLQQALRGVQNINNGILPSVNVEDINPKLVELEEALLQRDYILLADLLEYEITPIFEGWLIKVREALS
jgi:hypothetical protein